MERRLFFLCLLSFLMFAEGLSWIMAGGLGPCLVAPEHSEQATNNNNHQNCPTFLAGTLLSFERGAEILKRNDNEKAVVAGFTIVLAISTIGLWLATNRLWAAGERQLVHLGDTAERQLRAYIGIDNVIMTEVEEGKKPKLSLRVRNYGQTPAYRLCNWGAAVVAATTPLKSSFQTKDYSGKMVLDPDGVITSRFEKNEPLTPEEFQAIRSGSVKLYWLVRYKYRDAFKQKRITDVLYEAKFMPDGSALPKICNTGNRQT
jgi:hypothetical protein